MKQPQQFNGSGIGLPTVRPQIAPASSVGAAPQVSTRQIAQAGSSSDGSAAVYASMSKAFRRQSIQLGQIADKAAAVEGQREGAVAGLDAEFRPRGDITIYGQAYDRAAISTYESQLTTRLTVQTAAIYEKHASNPKALNGALAELGEGYRTSLFPEVLPSFEAQFTRQQASLVRQATRNQRAEIRAQQSAALSDELATRLKSLDQMAYRNGLDAASNELIAGEIADLEGRLSMRGPDGKPLVDPKVKSRMLRDAQVQVARSRIVGTFSRLEGLPAKQRFLADVEERYAKGGDPLLDQFDVAGYERLTAHLTAIARKEGTSQRAALKSIEQDIEKFAKGAGEGISLPEEELAALKGRVAQSGSAELVGQMNEAIDELGLVSKLNSMTPGEVEAVVTAERVRLRKDGQKLEGRDLDRLTIAENYLNKQRVALKTDPLGWAARTGRADIAPLDIADAGSVQARISQAETIAEENGRAPQYLRPEERARLETVAQQGGEGLIVAAGAIAETFGKRAPIVLSEIAAKGEGYPLAIIGGLLHQGADDGQGSAVAKDAAHGIALRHADAYKTMAPSAPEARAQAIDVAGGALGLLPRHMHGAISVANSAYEVRARKAGVSEFDADLWQSAFKEALGEREIAGEKYGGIAYSQPGWLGSEGAVVVPMNVKQDGFRDLIETIRLEDLPDGGPMHGDGTNAASLADLRRAHLVTMGDGRYALNIGTVDQPRYLTPRPGFLAASDDHYILDLKALEPVLRERRPDLYLGG